jgi:hypothetical protein
MAALIRGGRRAAIVVLLPALASAAMAAASCGKLVGFGGPVTSLATVQVQVTGDVGPLVPDVAAGGTPRLRVALVWGLQWLPEPLCLLPPDTDAVAAVVAAGCPDILGFVPSRVAADAPLAADGTATLELLTLPAADVMVGDVTARVAYGSIYVYDDRNGNGTLDLYEPPDFHERHGPPVADAGVPPGTDIVYGASFVSMTLPDQRLAFREGAFNASVAFYPRAGCPDPPQLFSILSAGGFSLADAITAAATGQLPQEDPATCGTATLDQTVVTFAVQAPDPIKQLRCVPQTADGTTLYRQPPRRSPDLANLPWACTSLPRLPGDDGGVPDGSVDLTNEPQLIIAGPLDAECMNIWHYVLRGCSDGPPCVAPWGLDDGGVPDWWPCPTTQ